MKQATIGLIALLWTFAGGLNPAAAATISLGTRIDISLTTFALPIEITDGSNVLSWQVDLSYDPSDVLVNVACDPFSGDVYCSLFTGPATQGDFFAAGAPFNLLNPGFVILNPTTLQQAGLLSGINGAFGGVPPLPSGAGVLAFVEFTVIGAGTRPISVNGPVVSELTPVPEPSTLWLTALGILLPRVWRKAKRTARP